MADDGLTFQAQGGDQVFAGAVEPNGRLDVKLRKVTAQYDPFDQGARRPSSAQELDKAAAEIQSVRGHYLG